jgi:hypothetical protein
MLITGEFLLAEEDSTTNSRIEDLDF